LGHLINEVAKIPESLEIDPDKVTPQDDVNANRAKLDKFVHQFLETILGSVDKLPL